MSTSKQTQKQKVLEELTPKADKKDQSEASEFKIKDKFFDKVKTYIETNTDKQKEIEVDWKRLCVGGVTLVLFKNKPLTTNQLANFDESAKAYWLDVI